VVGSPLSYRISDRLLVNVTDFQNEVWFHIKDTRKSKVISVKESDIRALSSRRKSLLEAGRKISQDREKNKKEKKQKGKLSPLKKTKMYGRNSGKKRSRDDFASSSDETVILSEKEDRENSMDSESHY
jgi:hypothetical protein